MLGHRACLGRGPHAGSEGEGGSGGWPLPPHPCCPLQGQACRLQGKEDAQDFTGLVKALQALGLCAEELTAVWSVLATVLQLGNICFCSSEVSSLWSSRCSSVETNRASIHKDAGSIPDLTQWVKDQALP